VSLIKHLKDMAMSEANVVVQQYRFSRALGDSVSATLELQSAIRQLGGDAEEINPALTALARTISRAMSDSPTRTIFERLSLDIFKLRQMNPSDAFIAVAEAISKLENPSEKAALATQLFGDKAAALLPLLDQGAAGIAELRNRAREFGQSVGELDASNIEDVVLKLDEVAQRIEGLGKQLAVQAAAKSWVDGIGVFFETLRSYVTTTVLHIVESFYKIIGKITRLASNIKLPGLGEFSKSAGKFADESYEMAAAIHDQILAERKAREEIGKDVPVTPPQIQQRKRDKDNRMTGRGSVPIATKDIERLSRGLEVIKDTATPLEKFNDRMNDLNLLVNEGAIGWVTYGRAAEKAINELSEFMGEKQINFAGAVGKNSAEAYSASIRNQRQGEQYREDPAKRLERLQQSAIELQRQQLEQQRRIADALAGAKAQRI
jgi:hypothetical protein